jgi:hypothetical protein
MSAVYCSSGMILKMPSRGCYLSFSAFMDAGCRPVYVLTLCVYRYQHLMFGLFVLAYLSLVTYLGYQLVIFFFRNIFELHININDWHFDFTWDYIHKTPATASPVTWNSSTTTVVNPTPAEDLWPGHPTWTEFYSHQQRSTEIHSRCQDFDRPQATVHFFGPAHHQRRNNVYIITLYIATVSTN